MSSADNHRMFGRMDTAFADDTSKAKNKATKKRRITIQKVYRLPSQIALRKRYKLSETIIMDTKGIETKLHQLEFYIPNAHEAEKPH